MGLFRYGLLNRRANKQMNDAFVSLKAGSIGRGMRLPLFLVQPNNK